MIGVYGPTPRVCGTQRGHMTAAVRDAAEHLSDGA